MSARRGRWARADARESTLHSLLWRRAIRRWIASVMAAVLGVPALTPGLGVRAGRMDRHRKRGGLGAAARRLRAARDDGVGRRSAPLTRIAPGVEQDDASWPIGPLGRRIATDGGGRGRLDADAPKRDAVSCADSTQRGVQGDQEDWRRRRRSRKECAFERTASGSLEIVAREAAAELSAPHGADGDDRAQGGARFRSPAAAPSADF